jgi:hypothetical protein
MGSPYDEYSYVLAEFRMLVILRDMPYWLSVLAWSESYTIMILDSWSYYIAYCFDVSSVEDLIPPINTNIMVQ